MDKNEFDVDEILAEIDSKRNANGLEDNADIFSNEYNEPEKKSLVTNSFGRDMYDWLSSLAVSLLTVVMVLTFVARINEVQGQSMEPTLVECDRLLVYELFYTPSFGDIVVIQADNLPNAQTGEMGEPIVKRVIGLSGDVIDIDAETGTVYRNGEALSEDYIAEPISAGKLGNAEYPLTVPENHVFVLGDNRNHSTDSRFVKDAYTSYYVGCVDIRNVVGKAIFRIYPFDRFGVL